MANLQLFIGETVSKGRGMFTKKGIKAETIIETSPVIVMGAEDRAHLDKTLLHDYIFEWKPNGENWCCMALGCIPLYNHSYASNCEYFMDYDNQTMYIQAIRNIKAGEELTINYSGTWNDEMKVWFDVL